MTGLSMRFLLKFFLLTGFGAGITSQAIGDDYLRPSVPSGIDHSRYEELLQKYVNARGMVDYGPWKASREDMKALNGYLEQFAPPPDRKISRNEEAASLINAYNALTIKSILENYPVESILLINDVWSKRRHPVGGIKVSLDDIEKGALIPLIGWKVHSVVVCAARSCPPLQMAAYTEANLDQKIEEVYSIWLSRIDLNRFSSSEKRAEISQIFKWYEKDFEAIGGAKKILVRFAPDRHKPFLSEENFEIIHTKYHWGLNDKGGRGKNFEGSLLDVILN